jgi:type I restriction enzyme S subunit
LKYVVDCNSRVLSEATPEDYEFTYVDIGNVTQGSVALDLSTVLFSEAPSRARRVAEPGDTVVSTVRTYLRAVATVPDSEQELVFSTGFAVLHPRDEVDPRFLSWYLQGDEFVSRVEATSTGVSYPAITATELINLDLQLPPLAEQKAIATYLDHETAQIDTLITEQQRLIDLQRERRQATVDAAFEGVGRGTVQLRRAVEFLTSGSRGWGDYYSEAGDRFVRIGNLPRTTLKLGGEIQHVTLPEEVTEGARTRLQVGDLLFSITAYLGSVAVVDEGWADAYVSQHVALCRLNSTMFDPRFVGYCMLTTDGQDQLKEGAAGGTKVQLALDDIRELRVPVVDADSQRRTVAHLDEQTTKIDALIAETELFIELARERRSALVTAAVTGQIDLQTRMSEETP